MIHGEDSVIALESSATSAETLLEEAQSNFDRESGEATSIIESVRLLEAQITRERQSLDTTQAELVAAGVEFAAAEAALAEISQEISNFDNTNFDLRLEALQEQLRTTLA